MESEKLAKCFHTDTILTTKCNYDATQLCQHAAEQSAKTELTSSVMMVGHRAVRCREETRRSNTRKQKKTCACSRSAAGRRRQSANFSAHRHKLHKYDHDDNVNDNKVGTVKYQQQYIPVNQSARIGSFCFLQLPAKDTKSSISSYNNCITSVKWQ